MTASSNKSKTAVADNGRMCAWYLTLTHMPMMPCQSASSKSLSMQVWDSLFCVSIPLTVSLLQLNYCYYKSEILLFCCWCRRLKCREMSCQKLRQNLLTNRQKPTSHISRIKPRNLTSKNRSVIDLIDGLIDCLFVWLIDWLIDWLFDWLIDWLIDKLYIVRRSSRRQPKTRRTCGNATDR